MLNLMKKLTAAYSVSGCETHISEILKQQLSPFADSVKNDALGNLILYKKGNDMSKKLMIAAHMDEIGFVATFIDENGFIRISNVGGIRPLYSSYHQVKFENGTAGVIVTDDSAKLADLKVKDLIVDIGAKNKKEAEKKISVGDTCAILPHFTKLCSTRYSAKAFDNRIGCAVAAYALMNLGTPAYDTYFVFTVQEEVGLRGSKTSAFGIMPDYSIAVDVTSTGDFVGSQSMAVKLGDGAAIKVKDSSAICSKKMVDFLIRTAKDNKIKYQLEILEAGGTDTASMQTVGAGSHACCISVPTRYIHSPVETLDLNDVKAASALLKAAAEHVIE